MEQNLKYGKVRKQKSGRRTEDDWIKPNILFFLVSEFGRLYWTFTYFLLLGIFFFCWLTFAKLFQFDSISEILAEL